ncbi:hypothetical protein D1631_08005 [Chryseobacterium nematophagum]|uniref:Chorismate-utilising enzyme C-terminal domain-containing protein n=1 Tax=Chryseobacterium nematophagum TaxID=2305228 RepID=A0A3M7TGX0_9FLAO|nr:chorismate-binding protein [Chryseobacterium nematophagum]RNA61879.1 hypothetical protein D1631_08005 [Chryseobacterium nematophagum]
MIYFKFPFNEKLYSIDENTDKKSIIFYSFDGLTQLNFKGNIIEIDSTGFDELTITNKHLPTTENNFIEETKNEYLQTLEHIIQVIVDHNLPKLVYSRRKIFKDFILVDLKESFKNLCNAYPNAFRYFFNDGKNAWIGAFSEVLGKFNKNTYEFETMSLAGTLPISESWSEKEKEEQKPVSEYIKNILKNYSEDLQISSTYDHISGNIKHLRTDFKIIIKPEDLENIIHQLHPTPAVCGIPKDFCIENINAFEKFPRELYAGYIKVETEDYIQFFVNLRCAKLYQDSIHSFIGGGITAQSIPEKEWMETELKSETVLKNLVIL